MRRPANPQEPLRTPLNEILGSPGSLRVLRVLAFSEQLMGRAQVARRAELNPSGVRRTLDRLAELGVVETVGSGRNRAVRLRERHPLYTALRSLFAAERDLFERTIAELRRQIVAAGIAAKAVWIESPEARSPGTIDVGALADPQDLERVVAALQCLAEAVEERLRMHFVVHGYTDADRLAAGDQWRRLEQVTLLHGWIPAGWRREGGGPITAHAGLDSRARRLAEAIAEILPNDPSLADRAREWIDQRLAASTDGRGTPALREWRRILTQLSISQVQALLSEDTERADRLRQSLPFVEVLSPSERAELLQEDRA